MKPAPLPPHRPEPYRPRRCLACGRVWPCCEITDLTVELETPHADERLTPRELLVGVTLGLAIVAANVLIIWSAVLQAKAP